MSDFPPNRRASDTPLGDTARIIAIFYTLGYFVVVMTLMWKDVPPSNKEIVFQLVGILSIIQSGITAYLYGASKSAEHTTKVLQDVVKNK